MALDQYSSTIALCSRYTLQAFVVSTVWIIPL